MFLPKIIDYSYCQIINGYLYQHDKSFIYIYDFSLKLVASISHPFRESVNRIQIIADTKKISKYAFIKSNYLSIIHILDTNSFSFVGMIDLKISIHDIISICNEKIILLDTKGITHVYKIEFRKKILEKIIDSKYICQINPLKPHLFKQDIYILPCGQSACLDCIFDNYNLLLRKFTCNSESCKENHALSDKSLKKNLELSNLVEQNIPNFISSIINFGNSICRDKEGLKFNIFYFDYIYFSFSRSYFK
jgi:hypothetical protein